MSGSVLPTTKISRPCGFPRRSHAVARDIFAAFADARRPDDDDIVVHECDDCAALQTAFAPLTWNAVPDTVIEEHPSNLPLFSPTAFAYFLPAYLLYALAHFTPHADASQHTVYALTPNPPDDHMADWHRDRLKPLTHDQMAVADRFLELVEADDYFGPYMRDVGEGRARFRELWDTRWSA